MKILMTCDTIGGVWQYSLELIRALAPHGVEVALATMGQPPDDSQIQQAQRLANAQLHVGDFKLEWQSSPWVDVARAGDWLMQIASRFKPDVIHLNGYAHASLPWGRPVLVVGHSCVLSWWQAVKGRPAGEQWAQYKVAVARGLACADTVVAPSRTMLLELERLYGPLGNVRVIHNARSRMQFRPAPKEEFIFSAGRLWDEGKNIAALRAVADEVEWPIYVAGPRSLEEPDPPAGQGLKELGILDEQTLASWMGRAAIYALPAYYEPFGLTALEAAMSGCALVLGDIDSLREIWGDAAAYVPPHDARELAFAIRYLQRDERTRRTLAAKAFSRALAYRPDRMSKEYLQTYDNIIRHKSPQPIGITPRTPRLGEPGGPIVWTKSA